MTSSQDDDDDDDDFLTKEDCLIEIVRGDDDDRHWDALMRFIELGGTKKKYAPHSLSRLRSWNAR